MTADELESRRAEISSVKGGVAACGALSDLMDDVVRGLLREHGASPSLPVLAIGGYGRRELAPRSDLDLLFLTEDPADEPAVRGVLQGLWDLRLQIGYAARGVSASVELAAEDLHTATALLTPRALQGDAHDLRAALLDTLAGPRTDEVLAALQRGMEERHQRFGGSVYLLEPNLKQSPGGLRDLAVLLWAAVLAHRVAGWGDLLPRGVLSPRAAREMARAREFLLRVRNVLHSVAPYGGDRLTFDHQELVAERLGFGHDRAATEQFLARYYEHASAVKRRAAIVLERCRELRRPTRSSRPPPAAHSVGDGFALFRGHLTVEDAQLFERDPRQVMRLFSVARALGVPVYGHAKERVLEVVPRLDEAWRTDPVVVEAFREVLAGPEDPHDALGDLHETGALGAMVPEFGAITHRTHHDLYHVYTVDIHTLHGIRRLKALHRGDLAEEEPLLTQAMGLVGAPFPLYVGLLMHDAGKALGRGHALKGARLVPPVAARLGMPREEAQDAEWLVRDHLLMAHLSQRRDLSDAGLIRQFCRQVGSVENLARLFVLTWADASTTGPQAYTDWKAALLAALDAAAAARFRAGLDLYEDPGRRVARLRKAVTDWLDRHGDPRVSDVNSSVDHFFASLPTAYFRRTRAREVARHLEMLEALEGGPVLEVVPRPRRGYSVVHVAAKDSDALLAAVCGVLSAHRLDVVSAELNHASDGRALHVFRVRGPDGAPGDDDARWGPVRRDLCAVLAGEAEVDTLIEEAHPTVGRFEWPTGPGVELQTKVDQTTSESCTILEIRARDRPALLYTIARDLAEAGVRPVLARITTEGEAALDTFYLQGAHGGRVDDGTVERLLERLRETL